MIKKKEEKKKERKVGEKKKGKRKGALLSLPSPYVSSKSHGARAIRSEKEEMPPGIRVHVPTRLAKQHRVRTWNSKNRNNDHPHRQGQTLGSDLPLPHLKVRMSHAFVP